MKTPSFVSTLLRSIVSGCVVAALSLSPIGLTSCASTGNPITTAVNNANTWMANPTNQANIEQAAQVLAAGLTLAQPYVSGGTAGNIIDGVQVVANAYSNNVPSNILQATTQNIAIAKQVAPLVTTGGSLTKANQILSTASTMLKSGVITPSNASAILVNAGVVVPANTTALLWHRI